MKKISYIKSKKFAIYVKKVFNTDKNDKNALKLYHKVVDLVTILENMEELLIVFAI